MRLPERMAPSLEVLAEAYPVHEKCQDFHCSIVLLRSAKNATLMLMLLHIDSKSKQAVGILYEAVVLSVNAV